MATGSESPTLSIGEAIAGQGNPFKSRDDVDAPSMWELEKQQLTAQLTLLTEQLKAETASRIESQVCLWYEGNDVRRSIWLGSKMGIN